MLILYRTKFSHKVLINDEVSESLTFTPNKPCESNENAWKDDDSRYHEYRDELLVMDSI